MHPSTIRATVSPTIITKVGRLFNGTVDDVAMLFGIGSCG